MFRSVKTAIEPLQLPLPGAFPSRTALQPDPGTDYGEVFTRPWVVELILDLVGYTADRDLGSFVLVEPSCGTGAFLAPIADRLITSSVRFGRSLQSLAGAVRAFDVLDANAERARKAVTVRFLDAGLEEADATDLASAWVTTGDFLLCDEPAEDADFVVGNPPYVRLENVPRPVMDAYRRRCSAMRGRSDLYIGFIERGLDLLTNGGVLGFICADRWMRNQYGSHLRQLVTSTYAVETVISMHDVDAFDHEVSAYPAIVVLRNGPQREAVVANAGRNFGEQDAARLSAWVRRPEQIRLATPTLSATRTGGWFDGGDLWPTGDPGQLALVADLEARFPSLEDAATGTRDGIGVATGCDDVFITTDPDLVERDRLLPLLLARDTATGVAGWCGTYLVNPWDGDGLVDLDRFPRLRRYLTEHAGRLRARHVARKRPAQWYRTIDRIDPGLLSRPKIVLPDMKAASHPVLDEGSSYPHHNLYFVASERWDPEVLGGLLMSEVANLFVGAYCVRMRGGCYRFQAQYLRRIRVPPVDALTRRDCLALATAFAERDVEAATKSALRLYGLKCLPGNAGVIGNER